MADAAPPSLSYVLTTRNKLPYLRCVVEEVLAHREPDEELVVTDGASTDGSAEYLETVHAREPLVTVVSEPDVCQADGMNKALLLARGDVIKILTDDDVFCWAAIQHVKAWLRAHPEVQYVVGSMAEAYLTRPEDVAIPAYLVEASDRWLSGEAPFAGFGDLIVMYRRRALPVVGLYHTGVACIDYEQAYRLTSQRQLQIAFFRGVMACRLLNPHSVTYRPAFAGQVYRDLLRLQAFYGPPAPVERPEEKPGPLRRAVRAFREEPPEPTPPPWPDTVRFPEDSLRPVHEAFQTVQAWMAEHNGDLARQEFVLGPPPMPLL